MSGRIPLEPFALARDPSIHSALARVQNSDNWPMIGCLGLFGLVVLLALVWALVIAPRRAGRLLRELAERGYAETDKTGLDLLSAMDTLAPFMLEGRAGENPRFILDALARTSGMNPGYVVNVSQSDGGTDSITTWQTLVLESKPVALAPEFCVRLRELDSVNPGREEQFGFRKVSVAGLLPEFESLYSVFSKGRREVPLSAGLQQAFVDVSAILPAAMRPITKFSPQGWGICASDVWQDRTRLRNLLDAADRISAAI